ncbi:hypothetical protein Dimus_007447 [Dionaea muscipula]
MSNATTSDPTGLLGGSNGASGGFTYGIGVSVGVLLLISTITLTSYCCTRSDHNMNSFRRQLPRARSVNGNGAGDGESHCAVDIGIDEATLMSYPKVLYSSKAASKKKDCDEEEDSNSTPSSCSICLAEYKSKDLLRLLPDCGHLFHLRCVDPWLRINASCPLCRMSPLPTPLAEVVPMTNRRAGE